MLQSLRAKHPILYCLLAEALFIAALWAGSFALVGVVLGLRCLGFWLEPDDYLLEALAEVPGIVLAIIFLSFTDETKLLTRRGSGFFNGLLVGMFPLAVICYSLIGSIALMPADAELHEPWNIFWFFVSMFAVGMAEEFLSRAVVGQTLLEHFGTSRAGVWKACLLSGAIFGAGHLINMVYSKPLGVLMQCLVAAALGALFAAIYYRTGNIWVVVFLHAMMDIAALWYGGVYGEQTMVEVVDSYSVTSLYTALLYGLPMVFLLRGKKLHEVELYFGCDMPRKG